MAFKHRIQHAPVAVVMLSTLALAACTSAPQIAQEEGYSPRVVQSGKPVPRGGGNYKVGKPYTIKGQRFVPKEDPGYDRTGVASWYGDDFHGRLTANGEVYDMYALTAAHPTLPMPTYARVTNLQNDKSVIVRINDRGPFAKGRIIDLSKRTAQVLDFKSNGVAKVRVQYIGRAPLDGEDEWLTTTVRNGGTSRQVAKIDRKLAAQSFASDNQRGRGKRFASVAREAYSSGGRTLPRAQSNTQFASAAPSAAVAQPVLDVPEEEPSAPSSGAQELASGSANASLIQAGLFSTRWTAQSMAGQLNELGTTSVFPANHNGERLYGVMLQTDGSLSAEQALDQARAAGAAEATLLQ